MLELQIKSNSPDIFLEQTLIKSAIDSEVKNLQRALTKTDYLLKQFEEKYHISSDFFLDNYTAEDLQGADDEYITWLGEIKTKERLIYSLEKLQKISYVIK
ncbi:hypothetical protein A5482_000105 [Cyanobacterium sp. IPPAS B-1200]|uniref:hypothetical protein n=1 Tax=Cyanobacterium sp. IPPAS B-1200 TaxID=1562720 RepID=UPI0008528A1F|nr:hypothetical protein [Cyanobacterium sp. IPPAS B-1200]OEJ79086.1 hypothetical protein A5482_11120 [Cyanobacterium sp. IPPAS B-1200]